MRKITCRNGLVWQARLAAAEQGRRARLVFVAAICLGWMVTSARGGSLDAPAGPNSPASAMWTLKDIYDVLDTRTTNVTKRTVAFAEPTAGPTTGTMHNLNDIMMLVTNRAPVEKTGQTTSYINDDGWCSTNVGVAWPNPRFTVQGDTNAVSDERTNCVVDNLTGLIWARNANLASNTAWSVNGTCTWATAFNVITNSTGPVNGASYGGYTDWRLPNRRELESLINYRDGNPCVCNTAGTSKWTEGNPFTRVLASYYYWTSTTLGGDTTYAWTVFLNLGDVGYSVKTLGTRYVWPVRGGGK